MRTFSTIAAAVLVMALVCVAALALRAGSMKPAAVREEWEDFKQKTIDPLRANGFFQPWQAPDVLEEEGFLKDPTAAKEAARSDPQTSRTAGTAPR